jgi:glycosyltransferase involved in cell wall biosynthesis
MASLQSPQLSVIIPTYNCDRYLGQALDSVFSQSYRDYEVIVVDDGSTDHTATLLRSYGSRVQAIHQTNQGVAVARNHGIQAARGEWVAFLDADDFLLPDKLEKRMAIATAQPHLGMIHSGWQRVNSQGEFLMDVQPWLNIPQLNLESWLRWKPVLPSAMLFRRECLEQAGGFDPRFPPAEDTDLVLRLAAMGYETAWLQEITVGYRQHENSAMHKGLPQAKSLAAVIDNFFAQPNLPESIRWLEQQTRYNTLVWIAWYLHYTGHLSEMVEFLQRSWHYSPYRPMETLVHWADGFTAFSQAWGSEFNAEQLARSPEWRSLMQWMVTQA